MFNWLGYETLQALLRYLRSADLQTARQRGAALGRRLFQLDPKWKHLAIHQVRTHLDATAPDALIRHNYEHYGRMLAELACVDLIAADTDRYFVNENEQNADVIRDGGLVISAHLGNWELMGLHHARRHDHRLAALVKPIANRYVDAWINGIRHGYGVATVTTRNNAMQARRRLRAGEVLVTLADQNSLYHEGLFVPFFKAPASTHYGPAMLALRENVPIITAFCVRTETGFRVLYGEPVTCDQGDDLRSRTWHLTHELTRRVETVVRDYPEQWFWVHRRWKNQPRDNVDPWKYGPEGDSWLKQFPQSV